MADTANCQKCQSEIPVEATRCPECGYEPSTEGARARWWGMFIGAILTMTGIGAIIGIPLFLMAYYGKKTVEGRKPTTHNPQ